MAGHGLVSLTAGSAAKRALAIRPGGTGDITDTGRIAWRYQKGTAYKRPHVVRSVLTPVRLVPFVVLRDESRGPFTILAP